MANEFSVHLLNEQGLAQADKLKRAFEELWGVIESVTPMSSRPKSVVLTKLQEASMWAKRAMAELPENQKPDGQ
jgi:hypothetical protein